MSDNSVPYLWRDDGIRFSRNEDGTYSMDDSGMANPYKYTYGSLMNNESFSVCPPDKKIEVRDNEFFQGALQRLRIALGMKEDSLSDATTIISISASRINRLTNTLNGKYDYKEAE